MITPREMDHIFLFKEGLWIIRGSYYTDRNEEFLFEGETRVSHGEDLWLNEGEMKINVGDKMITLNNRYEIRPFVAGESMTVWKTLNPDVGTLRGRFVLVSDAIISTCQSENGEYTGTEIFIRVDDVRYRSWGMLLRGKEKLSSWSVMMQKIR